MKKHNILSNINITTMKKLLTLCVMLVGIFTCSAQTVIDNFNVGPYIVDYNGQGDVKYRLRDNINLYEFFELKMDTTVIALAKEVPVKHAIEIAGNVGANRYASKEIGLEGVWKQLIGKNLYFNGGLLLNFGLTNYGKDALKRNMLEIGIPLQIELGKLNHQYASLYGSFGITPTFYSTMKAEGGVIPTKEVDGQKVEIDVKKSGFLVAPSLEFGGNIPVGSTIMRIGVYAKYKINCTTSDFDVYTKGGAGRMFLGAKIGFVL